MEKWIQSLPLCNQRTKWEQLMKTTQQYGYPNYVWSEGTLPMRTCMRTGNNVIVMVLFPHLLWLSKTTYILCLYKTATFHLWTTLAFWFCRYMWHILSALAFWVWVCFFIGLGYYAFEWVLDTKYNPASTNVPNIFTRLSLALLPLDTGWPWVSFAVICHWFCSLSEMTVH